MQATGAPLIKYGASTALNSVVNGYHGTVRVASTALEAKVSTFLSSCRAFEFALTRRNSAWKSRKPEFSELISRRIISGESRSSSTEHNCLGVLFRIGINRVRLTKRRP